MAELPTEEDQALWDQYIGPNGVPRLNISAPVAEQPLPSEPTEFDNDPFVRAAERLRRRHQQFPVYGPPAPEKLPSYLIEPDLLEVQQGQHLPTNMAYNDAGIPFNINTGVEIPTVRRPNILPVASTPEGPTFAMPKVLDLVGNLMGGVAGAPVKAGEVLLGSGPVRKAGTKLTPVEGNPFTASEEARLARGRELGYDVDNTLYHATDAKTNFQKFKNGNGELGEGTYLTTDKNDPLLYHYSLGENGRVLPVNIKQGDLFDFGALRDTQLVGKTTGKEKAINEVVAKYIKNNTIGYKAGDEDLVKDMIANQLSRTGDINFILKQAGYVGGFSKTSQMPNQVIVFDPANIKSKFAKFKGDGNLLLSDTRNQVYSQIGHELEKPKPFFSALEKAVDTAKVGKASADQWLGYLKNQPGVKSEEIATVLKDLPQGPITKSEMQGIVQNNKVSLNENWNPTHDGTEKAYAKWQLPGAENYREMTFTLPTGKLSGEQAGKNLFDNFVYKGGGQTWEQLAPETRQHWIERAKEQGEGLDYGGNFKSSHYDDPNYLAHIRMNDRTVDGGKTLHLEEIQSDRHQLGRQQGYKLSDKQKQDLDNIEGKLTNNLTEAEIGNPDIDNILKVAVDKKIISSDEAKNYKEYVKGENSTVPDAPFKKNWDELALKRMLHKAAVEGYEGISWTPGEAQAARYDLSKSINTLEYNTKTKTITAYDKHGDIALHKPASEKELADYIGKEAAEKIINNPSSKKGEFNTLNNADLKIGGEGMKSFYDKMLVDKANTLAKKYGSKVEQKFVNADKNEKLGKGSITERAIGGYRVEYPNGLSEVFRDKIDAEKSLANWKSDKNQPIHYLPITPELRQKAKEGFPLFSTSPTLTAVQHDPFQDQNKKYKLVPIQGNPFQ